MLSSQYVRLYCLILCSIKAHRASVNNKKTWRFRYYFRLSFRALFSKGIITFSCTRYFRTRPQQLPDISARLFGDRDTWQKQFILALNSRSNEIQADTFAYDIGYGRELISSMYLIQKISMGTNVGILEKMKATHPHMAYRIANLERLENDGYGE